MGSNEKPDILTWFVQTSIIFPEEWRCRCEFGSEVRQSHLDGQRSDFRTSAPLVYFLLWGISEQKERRLELGRTLWNWKSLRQPLFYCLSDPTWQESAAGFDSDLGHSRQMIQKLLLYNKNPSFLRWVIEKKTYSNEKLFSMAHLNPIDSYFIENHVLTSQEMNTSIFFLGSKKKERNSESFAEDIWQWRIPCWSLRHPVRRLQRAFGAEAAHGGQTKQSPSPPSAFWGLQRLKQLFSMHSESKQTAGESLKTFTYRSPHLNKKIHSMFKKDQLGRTT